MELHEVEDHLQSEARLGGQPEARRGNHGVSGRGPRYGTRQVITIDWGSPPLVTTTVPNAEICEIVIVCWPPGGSVPCVGESAKLVGSGSGTADQFADRVVLGLFMVTVVVELVKIGRAHV